MMQVIEKDGALLAGPELWPGSLAAVVGLRGNALPPLPYATEAGTLREAVWVPGEPPEGKVAIRGTWADGEVDAEGRWAAPTVFEDAPEPPPPPVNHMVRKLLIIDRLDDTAFAAAMHVMDSDRRLYERWQAASYILSDDEGVRALLVAIGTDPDVILAPEDDPP